MFGSHETRRYLQRRGHTRALTGTSAGFPGPARHGIVIPAMAERSTLPHTLAALDRCTSGTRPEVIVLVVVNNPVPLPAPPAPGMPWHDLETVRAENLATMRWLEQYAASTRLRLAWIDAASSGHELPGTSGVGMARRIGCDTAVSVLLETSERTGAPFDPTRSVLLHLDADALVEPDYLSAAEALLDSGQPGGTIAFRHAPAPTRTAQNAIDHYELWLHFYAAGLAWAGSPYGYCSMGSCMACTVAGYVHASGMPAKRRAGEDFYFLQELAKVGGVAEIGCTTVYPSPRVSRRVPFGTGARMWRALEQRELSFSAWDPRAFEVLRRLLASVTAHAADPVTTRILDDVGDREAAAFLHAKRFAETLSGFRRQYKTGPQRLAAFHRWFDALASFRLINHLTQSKWPERALMQVWAEFLERQGVRQPPTTSAELLEWWLARRGWRRHAGSQDAAPGAAAAVSNAARNELSASRLLSSISRNSSPTR